LLNEKGTFSFITPNNWLTLDTNSDLREFILKETFNIKLLQNYANVFESASVDTVIIGFNKKGPSFVEYLEWIDKKPTVISRKNKEEYLSKSKYLISQTQDNLENSFMYKIKGAELQTICDVKNGVQAYTVGEGIPLCTENMKNNRVYHSNVKIDDNWLKYLDGVDVGRYNLGWSGQFIKYGKNLSRPRQYDLFKGDRLLVRQIPNQLPYCINATFIDELTINDNNSMIIKPVDKNYNIKYTLAILNSKLISKWFAIYFGKLSRKIFPQFKINELRIFPIAKASRSAQIFLEDLVNNIYTKKNKKEDSSYIEKQIDNIVYRLYDLSYDEVKVIDPEFSLSKNEYESIQLE
jgi:adenine-specific DNA-methyltransferase